MQTIALWQITGSSLIRVSASQIDIEKSLEDWIERDPSLVQKDLVIVGRQLTTAAGRLDLLGIDPQGEGPNRDPVNTCVNTSQNIREKRTPLRFVQRERRESLAIW
jgi:RecB family endonuclease NucS